MIFDRFPAITSIRTLPALDIWAGEHGRIGSSVYGLHRSIVFIHAAPLNPGPVRRIFRA